MKLNFHQLNLHLAQPWVIARGRTDVANVILIELTDEAGNVGRGEAAPISRYKESVQTAEAFLKKLDAARLNPEGIPAAMDYLDSVVPGEMAAKCGVNIALLDLAGKRAKKPIYDLLGLGFREGKHVTSYSIGLANPEVTRQKVLAAADYPVLKLKVGGDQDEAALQALREVAPQKIVRVDANEGWKTKEDALKKIEWFARDKHVEFVEQPMPAATSQQDWQWLKERSPLPIFADESYHTAKDMARAAECFHGVNVKLVKTAGISGGFEALSAARKAGLKTMIGCMIETSVLISAAAQLAELCDYMDIDGNLLITDDPYAGVTAKNAQLSFANVTEKYGLRVSPRK